jgi:transcription elongation factor Elf1
MAKVSLIEVMAIVWECETCETEFETQAPIYETVKGESVFFSCESCGHDYEVELEERQ